MRIRSIYLLICLCINLVWFNDSYAQYNSIKGEYNLVNTDFESTDFVSLNTEWLLYYGDFVDARFFDTIKNPETQKMPAFWKNKEGKEYPSLGVATYRLKILVNPTDSNQYALYLNNIHNAYQLFVNGNLVKKNGVLGKSAESTEPLWQPDVVPVTSDEGIIDIIFQISNFHHRNGGVQDAIHFGYLKNIDKKFKIELAGDLFLAGSAMFLGIFFIAMFFYWRDDRATLYFGIFSFAFSIRILCVGTRAIGLILPDLPFWFLIRLEYIDLFILHYSWLYFVNYIFPNIVSKLYLKALTIITVLFSLITLMPSYHFTYLMIVNNYLILLSFIYGIYIFYLAFKTKREGVILAVLNMGLFFVTSIPVLIEYSGLFNTSPIVISVLYSIFILNFALIFAARYAKKFANLKSLTVIEEKKTARLRDQQIQLENKTSMISDSLNYAKRIQQSIIPPENVLRQLLSKSFVIFKPQSVVSGDFYWTYRADNSKITYIVVGDCTGHGVPGAFLSLISISALNKIIANNEGSSCAVILTLLNEEIITRVNPYDTEEYSKDGLDATIIKLNENNNEVEICSANQRAVIMHDGKIHIYKGLRHNLGSVLSTEKEFKSLYYTLNSDDMIYLFSDGVYDQRGGAKMEKLYFKRFVEVLDDYHNLPVSKQKNKLDEFITDWIGNGEQLDDITLLGIKL